MLFSQDEVKEGLSQLGKAAATQVVLDKISNDPETRKAVIEQLTAKYWYVALTLGAGLICLIIQGIKQIKKL